MADEIKEEIKAENEEEIDKAHESDGGESENAQGPKKNGKAFYYTALACTILSGIFFGLTFVLGVYSLLSAILFCLASLSLSGTQKKRENFNGVTALTVVTYIFLGIFVAVFVGGVIWSSLS